jgi:Tfp pilus assembly protein PilO
MSVWRRIYEERKRVVLPLLLILAVNAVVFVVVILPLRQNVGASTSARDEARFALATAQLRERQARDAKASRERADQDLRRFYTEILPPNQATATRATNVWLQQAAIADGLQFTSSNASQTAVRDSRLSRATSTVSLRGQYQNIRQLLHAVESAEEFIIIERVELSQNELSPSGAGGVLNVQLQVATYYPTEPAR